MALNGLDAPNIQKAFEHASADSGWFMLKYVSRDDIDLLATGSSAIREMRELAFTEPDDSPLYAFIRYRRRNIMIKMVPENTSRVLKARSQVHFQSIVERFAPCDVSVSLSSPRELTDAALTAACSSHTANASVSSSSSSARQRRLTNIAESAEEYPESRLEEVKIEDKLMDNHGVQVIVTTHDPGLSPDGFPVPIEVEISRPEPIRIDDDIILTQTMDSDERRSISSEITSHTYKPESKRRKSPARIRQAGTERLPRSKVKLGPRPSADWPRRPHTSASTSSKDTSQSQEEYRPSVSLPKSIQFPTRKSGRGKHSLDVARTPLTIIPPPPHPSETSSQRSSISFSPILLTPTAGVPKSPLASTPSPPGISPEKARLMKALELRKKAMSVKVVEAQAVADGAPVLAEPFSLNPSEIELPPTPLATQFTSQSPSDMSSIHSLATPSATFSSSTEQDSQASLSDVDKESESSYNPSDLGDTLTETASTVIIADVHFKVEETTIQHSPTFKTPERKQEVDASSQLRRISIPNLPQNDETNGDGTSPITPMSSFPLSPVSTSKPLKKAVRTYTRDLSCEVPVLETARSVSAPFLTSSIEKKPIMVAPRKVNVSSGSVSQRIRQLELLSKSKPQAQNLLTPPRSRPSSPIPQFPPSRKASLKSMSSSPNLSPLATSTSVSPAKLDTEDRSINNHSPPQSPEDRGRSQSLADIRMTTPTLSKKEIFTQFLQQGRAKSKSPPQSPTTTDEKKGRFTPILRRMSSSMSKKPIIRLSRSSSPIEKLVTVLITAWVNVQLPDTMLWKRRYMKVESNGNLVLSASEDENGPQTKKWNVSEEAMSVTIPDVDEQELPHSVHIMLKNGGILQCACQNMSEQNDVVKAVKGCLA